MAMRRSTQMLILGLAVFVIGAGVVIIALGGSGGDSAAPAVTTTTIQAGTVVIPAATGTPVPTTFTIPDGKQAVGIQVPFVAGLAGYAKPGDLVNVYATIEKAPVTPDAVPPLAHTKMVLPGVEVLAVTGPGPGAGAGNTTYLLALDAVQAEQAIFFARFESLWLTLAPKGQPTPSTPGRSYKNAL
ncbi:MAG: RcpC/CpaB family pilus assembly protein [Actinomycetota bacterium]|nr:RcpC/CpaB family pilus assembly protein [Actinomycetota bacterium]